MAPPTLTTAFVDAAFVDTTPDGAVRGTVLILPGRGDRASYYRRLATRLAIDGYASRVAAGPIQTPSDIAAVWDAEAEGVRVVIGVDTSAGILAETLAAGALHPAPAGVVFAGVAVPGGERPTGDDELAARSACPVFRGVALAEPAEPLAASAITPVWPTTSAAIPALVVHGEADIVAPVDDALRLYDGWDADVVTVTGGLHDVLNDVHHRSVAAEIVAFLERRRIGATRVLTRVRAR